MKNSGSTKKASKPKQRKTPKKMYVDREMLHILYNGDLLDRIKLMDDTIEVLSQYATSSGTDLYLQGMINGMSMVQCIIKGKKC